MGGRLSKEEIDQMVADAEKFKSQDDAIRKKVEAKNSLENYCFQMKNTLNDDKLKDKFTDEDKKTIEDLSAEGLQYVEVTPRLPPRTLRPSRRSSRASSTPS